MTSAWDVAVQVRYRTLRAAAILVACANLAAASAPASAAELDPNRRLPPILMPDRAGSGSGSGSDPGSGDGRVVPRQALPIDPYTPSHHGAARSPLSKLFRGAAGTAGTGLAAPDLAVPTELRRRLAIPDFSQPLPIPGSEPSAPVVAARPDATAVEQPYASRLLRIPLSTPADAGEVPQLAISTAARRAIAEDSAAAQAQLAPPTAHDPDTPPAPAPSSAEDPSPAPRPSLALAFRPGSAAVPAGAGAAIASFAAEVMASEGSLVRLRVAAPGELPPETGQRLAHSRARALRQALAERRIRPDRVAVALVSAAEITAGQAVMGDAVLELVQAGALTASDRPGRQ